MVHLNWTNQAVSDLKEIADYISKDSIKYAKIQVKRLKKRTIILREPEMSKMAFQEGLGPKLMRLCLGLKVRWKVHPG